MSEDRPTAPDPVSGDYKVAMILNSAIVFAFCIAALSFCAWWFALGVTKVLRGEADLGPVDWKWFTDSWSFTILLTWLVWGARRSFLYLRRALATPITPSSRR